MASNQNISNNYERLTKELKEISNHEASLGWILKILNGTDSLASPTTKAVIGVKQSAGGFHEAIVFDMDTDITKDLMPIMINKYKSYQSRINEIQTILQSVDKLLESK